jgi:hypothetical protein
MVSIDDPYYKLHYITLLLKKGSNSKEASSYRKAERIEYQEAHDRLIIGFLETSPIIWIGKPGPAIQG